MHDDEIRDEAIGALGELRRSEDPGRLLEERTVQALRNQGLLAAPARRALAPAFAWAAAAAVAFFVVGFTLGRSSGSGTTTSDAALRPVDTMNTSDLAHRDSEAIRIAAADTTSARGDRFVVWF